MAIGGWLAAALCAGFVGWLGRPVMVLLPEAPSAYPGAPRPVDLARLPGLGWRLAVSAVALVTVLFLALPVHVMPAWIIVCGVGTWLAYLDWHARALPTVIVVPLAAVTFIVVGMEAWIAYDSGLLWTAAAASALAVGSFWLLWWTANRRQSGSFSSGDVRLAVPLGLVLGSVGALSAVFGIVLGVAISWFVWRTSQSRGGYASLPFSPFTLAAAVIAAVGFG